MRSTDSTIASWWNMMIKNGFETPCQTLVTMVAKDIFGKPRV